MPFARPWRPSRETLRVLLLPFRSCCLHAGVEAAVVRSVTLTWEQNNEGAERFSRSARRSPERARSKQQRGCGSSRSWKTSCPSRETLRVLAVASFTLMLERTRRGKSLSAGVREQNNEGAKRFSRSARRSPERARSKQERGCGSSRASQTSCPSRETLCVLAVASFPFKLHARVEASR